MSASLPRPTPPPIGFVSETTMSCPTGLIPIEVMVRAKFGATKRRGGLDSSCLRKVLSAIGKLPKRGKKGKNKGARELYREHYKECLDTFAWPIWPVDELQMLGITEPKVGRAALAAYNGR